MNTHRKLCNTCTDISFVLNITYAIFLGNVTGQRLVDIPLGRRIHERPLLYLLV